MSIKNAKIESTHLGLEGHGIFTFSLHLKLENSNQGFGNFAWISSEAIYEVLKAVGVDKWEDLPGKMIRINCEGDGVIVAIGHIIDDKWFHQRDWTDTRQYRWREPR